jgi:hypothetical protein
VGDAVHAQLRIDLRASAVGPGEEAAGGIVEAVLDGGGRVAGNVEELLSPLALHGDALGELLEAARLGGEPAARIIEAEPKQDDAVRVGADFEDVLPRSRVDEDRRCPCAPCVEMRGASPSRRS